MTNNKIECPKCAYEFELSEVLNNKIRKSLEAELFVEIKTREQKLNSQQKSLQKNIQSLENHRRDLDEQINDRVKKDLSEMKSKIEADTRVIFNSELEDLKNQLHEKDTILEDGRKQELKLRKETRQLDQKTKDIELSVQRRLDDERKQILVQANAHFEEEFKGKNRQKDLLIVSLQQDIEKMKQRAEQGNMKTQGTAMEIEI